jgi:beta-lactam-binding protein with PASTA domain
MEEFKQPQSAPIQEQAEFPPPVPAAPLEPEPVVAAQAEPEFPVQLSEPPPPYEPVESTSPALELCPACGAELRPGARFCPKCGYVLDYSILPPAPVKSKSNNRKFAAALIPVGMLLIALITCGVLYGNDYRMGFREGFYKTEPADENVYAPATEPTAETVEAFDDWAYETDTEENQADTEPLAASSPETTAVSGSATAQPSAQAVVLTTATARTMTTTTPRTTKTSTAPPKVTTSPTPSAGTYPTYTTHSWPTPNICNVPSVMGLSENSANSKLKQAGIEVSVKSVTYTGSGSDGHFTTNGANFGKGNVVKQSPTAFSTMDEGSTVTINISLGFDPDYIDGSKIKIIDRPVEDVQRDLINAGFTIGAVTEVFSWNERYQEKQGLVFGASPSLVYVYPKGTVVDIEIYPYEP